MLGGKTISSSMSSFAADGEVTLLTDDISDSDSDDELFNLITDKTHLLHDQKSVITQTPVQPRECKKSVTFDTNKDGAKTGLRPEDMEEELRSESSKLLSQLPADLKESEAHKHKRRRVIRRFWAVCLIAFLLWTAMPLNCPSLLLLNIQDTQAKLIALGSFYGCLMVSALISPYVIQTIGERWIIASGCLATSVFMCLKFNPALYLIVPGYVIAGLGLGPCLGALWTHVVVLAGELSMFDQLGLWKVLGIFSGLFHTWVVGGPLLTQLLAMVSLGFPWSSSSHADSSTYSLSDEFIYVNFTESSPVNPKEPACGMDYQWLNFIHSPVFKVSDSASMRHRMQALLGSLLACAVAAFILAVLCIEKASSMASMEHGTRKCVQALGAALVLLKRSELLLLMPTLVYMGLRQHIVYEFFIQAFASCSLGYSLGSYVLVAALAAPLLLSSSLGFLISHCSRLRLVLPLVTLEASVLLISLVWPFDQWATAVYFIVACFLSIADCCWQIMCTCLLGQVFPLKLDAAMGIYRICHVLGFLFVYLYQLTSMRSLHLMTFALILLIASCVMYIAMEIHLKLMEQDARMNPEDHKVVMPNVEEAMWLPSINPMHVRKERTSALLHRMPNVVDPERVTT